MEMVLSLRVGLFGTGVVVTEAWFCPAAESILQTGAWASEAAVRPDWKEPQVYQRVVERCRLEGR